MSEVKEPTTCSIDRSAGGVARLQFSSFQVAVEDGPDRGRTVRLKGASLRVGSGADNDLPLSDTTASRRHVLLTLTAEGVLAEDLESRNGTWLNGARIRSAYVPEGGLLKVGNSLVRVTSVTSGVLLYPVEEESFHGLIGTSPAMREVFAMVRQLAAFDLPVAITGETGTGKELVARALHEASPRPGGKFRVLDCGSILPELLRAELFGHEKGAYTGADRDRRGILEEAAGGTVVLDEVGEIDLALQPQLLRALETREVLRIGSSTPVPVKFRLVSSTNRDLKKLAQEGRFRPDLFYRLSTVTLRIPSLRERREDIPLLVDSFRKSFARRHQLSLADIDAGALAALVSHDWPGNVRELKNAVESICALAPTRPVDAGLVEQVLGRAPAVETGNNPHDLEQIEKKAIEAALIACGWNRVKAAQKLGISRATLYEKLKRYGIQPPPSSTG